MDDIEKKMVFGQQRIVNVQEVTGASEMMRYAFEDLIRDLVGTPGAVAVHRIPHTGNADRTARPILRWGVTGD